MLLLRSKHTCGFLFFARIFSFLIHVMISSLAAPTKDVAEKPHAENCATPHMSLSLSLFFLILENLHLSFVFCGAEEKEKRKTDFIILFLYLFPCFLFLDFYGPTGRMGMVSGRCCFSGPGTDNRIAAGLWSDGRTDRPPFSKGKRCRPDGSRSVVWRSFSFDYSFFIIICVWSTFSFFSSFLTDRAAIFPLCVFVDGGGSGVFGSR